MNLTTLATIYLICAICFFFTLQLTLSKATILEERTTNLEMACYVLIALLWPIESVIIFIAFLLLGPLIYLFRHARRTTRQYH